MTLARKINVPLVSISDIKKAPMKFFSLSKNNQAAVYVLNKNRVVGVILDIDEFNRLMDFVESAFTLIDDANEQAYQEKIMSRLNQDSGHRFSNEEVVGEDWQQGLDQIPDEWE
ncbi:MAG: type II toxin-antitoxin system Phd/YefM family antitoxin [Erysipelotrichaceae bacterium]|jgi:antitoxin StbD|nr:type II toxin-antitoxin system Phd/YefM family antitoxin [Erysipelotrichaceae bacterium]